MRTGEKRSKKKMLRTGDEYYLAQRGDKTKATPRGGGPEGTKWNGVVTATVNTKIDTL